MSLLRDKFISFLQLKGFTKATVRNYIQAIKQFQDWFGKSPVHVTRETAPRYLDYLKNGKNPAPRTMNINIWRVHTQRRDFRLAYRGAQPGIRQLCL